jgi:FkbM family methyltransferase
MSVIKQDWTKAKEILSQEGFFSLLKRIPTHIRRRFGPPLFDVYYRIKARLLDDYIVTINGVKLDLNGDVFSKSMIKQIRKKKYEQDEIALIRLLLNKDQPVVDLGAGIGFTTCYIDLSTETTVMGIEANEALIPHLERTRKINRANFEIVHSAYNPVEETVTFHRAADFWSSSQYDRENVEQQQTVVPATSLAALIDDLNTEWPLQLVADIEGGEHHLIVEEIDILRDNFGLIILELHSFAPNSIEFYREILEENGFEFITSKNDIYAFSNKRLVNDPTGPLEQTET